MVTKLKAVSSAAMFLTLCIASPFLPSSAATAISTAIVVVIGIFVLRAIFAAGPKRSFAMGFVLSSALYVGATIAAEDFTFKHLGHKLPTTQLLQSFVRPPVSDPPVIQLVGPEARLRSAHGQSFLPLGHFLIAIALGCAGGFYARRLGDTEEPARSINAARNAVA